MFASYSLDVQVRKDGCKLFARLTGNKRWFASYSLDAQVTKDGCKLFA